ncbi:MAG: SDR family NAD(P)-dependent oxidoreductase [Alphaproteobacteria bacterium]|nr:SDR family NAD(P)-dependent oxidoreductase [Alphaproteobacteria bacterium]
MTQGPVWITGASSGIGRALALRLARDGRQVIASARSTDALANLARENGNIVAWPLDVTDAGACEKAVAEIEAAHGPLALAVLNAGTHKATPATDFSATDFRALVDINLMGTVNALAPLLARRTKHIAVVASVAGYSGLPTAAGYGATKAALINMCEALKPECDALGIKLQLVDPGFVKTPLTDKNNFPMPFIMEVDNAVEALVRGLASDRFEIVFPRRFALILKFLRLLPYRLYFPLVRKATGK